MEKLLIIMAFHLMSLFVQAQTVYYISSTEGNDANPGNSEDSAWKTISKVNSMVFLPGDKVLFRRGDKWEEGIGLVINYSGTNSKRIIFGSYGSGVKPEISLSYKIIGDKWVNQGNNIWRFSDPNLKTTQRMLWADNKLIKNVGTNSEVIYVDGVSLCTTPNIKSASEVQTLNAQYRHKANSGSVDLYSTTNPAAAYSKIETFCNTIAITLTNRDYITIQDLKITKCTFGIYLRGSKNIIIDNVETDGILYSAVYATVNGTRKTTNLEIKNCTFDGGIGANSIENGVAYEYYWNRGHTGIKFEEGVDYAKVYKNIIKNFHHSEILILGTQTSDSTTTSFNEIYDNTLDMSDINWGRAFQINGTEIHCHDNKFYRNRIVKQNTGCELGGYHNYFYYNIWTDVSNRGWYGSVIRTVATWIALSSNPGWVSRDNYFFNNTVYNCAGQFFTSSNNHLFNNLVVNYHKGLNWNIPVIFSSATKDGLVNKIYKKNMFYTQYVTDPNVTRNQVYFNGTYYSIADWNKNNVTPGFVDGNLLLTSNPISNTTTFDIRTESQASEGGIDISEYVPPGFKDRNGNTVNRTSPSIGAIQSSSAGIKLNVKIYLQSPFKSGIMNTLLSSSNKIPLSNPYNKYPWNYTGSENVQSVLPEIVDWILIELRTDTSAASAVSRRTAFIKNNGNIVDLDGISLVSFPGINSGNYYVVIMHRNHISTMSANKISLTESPSPYDFTTSPSKAFGNDLADLGNGNFGMYSGDGDANGVINVLDYGSVGNNLFKSEYELEDLDLNGIVNVLDFGKTNINLLKTSNVPGTIFLP